MRFKTLIALITAAAVLAACQPLPQPFKPQDERRLANPLLRIADGSGIVVQPVAGLPPEAAAQLAVEMADALLKRNLPAFTGDGNRASYRLSGEALAVTLKPGRTDIRLIWKLTAPRQTLVGEYVLDMATREAAWTRLRPGLIRDLATKSAGPVAAMIQDPIPHDLTTKPDGPALYVAKIEGAPEIAAALLRTEMEAALRGRYLRITTDPQAGSITVRGVVSRTAGTGKKHRLALDWTVIAAGGGQLGTLHQANDVTGDQLEDDWPRIARVIARGAAEGVKNMLDRTPASVLRAGR